MSTRDIAAPAPLGAAKGPNRDEPPAHAELAALLDDLVNRPHERETIEQCIVEKFTQDKAVMVVDMSGFSRTAATSGIVTFLLMIHQMKLLALPCIDLHRGVLIKAEADNLYCLFESVEDAVEASLEISQRLAAANAILPRDLNLYVSTGVGWGPILNIGNEDMWGNEVNIACRLGEDIAELGEILLSQAAHEQTHDLARLDFDENTRTISQGELQYYRLAR